MVGHAPATVGGSLGGLPMTRAKPLLALRGVHHHFGRVQVLQGVDLEVHAGEVLALIGPNGAGKSTLFDVISGRVRPSAGQVWLQGRRVDGAPPHELRRLGLARGFQGSRLFDRLSVDEHLRLAMVAHQGLAQARWWHRDASPQGLQAAADRLLESLGLAGLGESLAATLGPSQRRRLELALLLAAPATILLLDEPTAGMAPAETAAFVSGLRRWSQGRTVLMVEHDMDVVFGLADRVAVLAEGRLLSVGRPEAVRQDAQVRQAYLGVFEGLPGKTHAQEPRC